MKKAYKISIISFISIIALLIIIIILTFTQPVLKGIVIPIIEKSAGAKISVNSISLSPLKGELTATKFNYIADDNSFSIKSDNLNFQINVMNIFDNKYIVDHFTAENSEIRITEEMKEKSANASIDLKADKKSKVANEEKTKPLLLDLKNINIKKLNFIYTMKRKKANESSILKILDSDINISKLKTGENGDLKFDCKIEVTSLNKNSKDTEGSFKCKTEYTLDKDSYPTYIKSESIMHFLGEDTPIDLSLKQQPPKKNAPAPFTFNTKIQNLTLMPLFKAFLKGSYSDSKGMLDSLELNIEGKNIENIDIKKNIEGSLALQVSNIEMPTQILDFAIAKIVFLPIYIIAHLNDYLADNDILPEQITNILGISGDILNGAKELSFKNGNIYLAFGDGIIDIRKFILIGDNFCSVRKMDFDGYIDLNSDMDVRTETNITGIIIPLRIEGSLEKPDPQVQRMIPALLGRTAENIVKTSAKMGVNLGKSVLNAAGSAVNHLIGTSESNNNKE